VPAGRKRIFQPPRPRGNWPVTAVVQTARRSNIGR
jgi:hypothetical protein